MKISKRNLASAFACTFLATLAFSPLICNGKPILKAVSPDKKYEFVVEEVPFDEELRGPGAKFLICDAQGKVIKELGKTDFPVDAVKWHQSAHALIVLEHLAHGCEMSLVTLQDGVWRMTAVTQFEKPTDFSIVNAISNAQGFECFYLVYNKSSDGFDADRTEVDISSGKAALKNVKYFADKDLPFFRQSLENTLVGMQEVSRTEFPRYEASYEDTEPDWVGCR